MQYSDNRSSPPPMPPPMLGLNGCDIASAVNRWSLPPQGSGMATQVLTCESSMTPCPMDARRYLLEPLILEWYLRHACSENGLRGPETWRDAAPSVLPPCHKDGSQVSTYDDIFDYYRLHRREESFRSRLHSFVQNGDISESTYEFAVSAWRRLWLSLISGTHGLAPIPNVGAGPDGDVLFAWDRGRLHLELEILPDGSGEYFFMDRQSEDEWVADYHHSDDIPERVIDCLQRIAQPW